MLSAAATLQRTTELTSARHGVSLVAGSPFELDFSAAVQRLLTRLVTRFPGAFILPRIERMHVTILRSKSTPHSFPATGGPPHTVAAALEALPPFILTWTDITLGEDGGLRVSAFTPATAAYRKPLEMLAAELAEVYGSRTRVQNALWATIANVNGTSLQDLDSIERVVDEVVCEGVSLPPVRVSSLMLVHYRDLLFNSIEQLGEYHLHG